MSTGTIVQCIGAVVDIQFPRNEMPKVYDALKLEDAANSFAEEIGRASCRERVYSNV